MDKQRPIQPRIEPRGGERTGAELSADRFREAFGRWAATVTVMAVRTDDAKVHATTVTSFGPVSAEPPMVMISLGPGAQVLPYLKPGSRAGVSILAEDQSRWASIFADSFPVRSPEWTVGAVPRIPGATAALGCTVSDVHPVEGGGRLVTARVDTIDLGDDERPLLYWRRAYRRLAEE